MSLDKSLKIRDALRRHRSVLTRAERVQHMKDEERWSDQQNVFGLPKTKVRRLVTKKPKPPKAEAEADATGEAEAAPSDDA